MEYSLGAPAPLQIVGAGSGPTVRRDSVGMMKRIKETGVLTPDRTPGGSAASSRAGSIQSVIASRRGSAASNASSRRGSAASHVSLRGSLTERRDSTSSHHSHHSGSNYSSGGSTRSSHYSEHSGSTNGTSSTRSSRYSEHSGDSHSRRCSNVSHYAPGPESRSRPNSRGSDGELLGRQGQSSSSLASNHSGGSGRSSGGGSGRSGRGSVRSHASSRAVSPAGSRGRSPIAWSDDDSESPGGQTGQQQPPVTARTQNSQSSLSPRGSVATEGEATSLDPVSTPVTARTEGDAHSSNRRGSRRGSSSSFRPVPQPCCHCC